MPSSPPVARTHRVLGTGHSPAPALPNGAWDTHVHVFGPADRYPYAADRSYTAPDALPTDLSALWTPGRYG
ncbi:hypothetical protein SSOG_00602 [Streptomyces himastatinicus ATCC 53653]|uniref:Amidohydrolase n=1 Tax=Streptomyces himastatinicus ATCC 53653 TaxID=457427 RepID=D9WCE3_9ACTN|nr:hypothetical protein [Streptomyces himastatinicus]EFL20891.1 hypothetical protein SSOG_00602 [Streptomyces himastatinicus ATCC 53653]